MLDLVRLLQCSSALGRDGSNMVKTLGCSGPWGKKWFTQVGSGWKSHRSASPRNRTWNAESEQLTHLELLELLEVHSEWTRRLVLIQPCGALAWRKRVTHFADTFLLHEECGGCAHPGNVCVVLADVSALAIGPRRLASKPLLQQQVTDGDTLPQSKLDSPTFRSFQTHKPLKWALFRSNTETQA